MTARPVTDELSFTREVSSLRQQVTDRLREAILSGHFEPAPWGPHERPHRTRRRQAGRRRHRVAAGQSRIRRASQLQIGDDALAGIERIVGVTPGPAHRRRQRLVDACRLTIRCLPFMLPVDPQALLDAAA